MHRKFATTHERDKSTTRKPLDKDGRILGVHDVFCMTQARMLLMG